MVWWWWWWLWWWWAWKMIYDFHWGQALFFSLFGSFFFIFLITKCVSNSLHQGNHQRWVQGSQLGCFDAEAPEVNLKEDPTLSLVFCIFMSSSNHKNAFPHYIWRERPAGMDVRVTAGLSWVWAGCLALGGEVTEAMVRSRYQRHRLKQQVAMAGTRNWF